MSGWNLMRLGLGLSLLLGIASAASLWLWAAPPGGEKAIAEEKLRPRWQVGDRWVVETTTQPIQARNEPVKNAEKPQPMQWQFSVLRKEKLGVRDCFVIEVTAVNAGTQPRTLLWVDDKAFALRQVETQLPVPGGFTSITENYDFGTGTPGPVMGPLSVLPLDLPMFISGKSGGKEKFSYESNSGAVGRRGPNDIGFKVDIEQSINPARAEDSRDLAPDLSRDLENKPLVRVELHTAERDVQQVWQVGQPWPVFSSNGSTTARLVKVMPAPRP